MRSLTVNVTLPPSLLIETEGVRTSRPGFPLGVIVRLMVSEVVDDETLNDLEKKNQTAQVSYKQNPAPYYQIKFKIPKKISDNVP